MIAEERFSVPMIILTIIAGMLMLGSVELVGLVDGECVRAPAGSLSCLRINPHTHQGYTVLPGLVWVCICPGLLSPALYDLFILYYLVQGSVRSSL